MLISAIIKAKDEEKNIVDCLKSLNGIVDEIIVVDDASSDGTKQLAREKGAKVVDGVTHHGRIDLLDIQGFKLARGKYLLRIDADERMTLQLGTFLREIAETGVYAGVVYRRRTWFIDRWVDHGPWARSEHLGLVRSDAWNREWSAEIHSQIPILGPVFNASSTPGMWTLHFEFTSVHDFIQNYIIRYAPIDAIERLNNGKVPTLKYALWGFARTLLGSYCKRLQIKQLFQDFVPALLLGTYHLVVVALMARQLDSNRSIERNNLTSLPRGDDPFFQGEAR